MGPQFSLHEAQVILLTRHVWQNAVLQLGQVLESDKPNFILTATHPSLSEPWSLLEPQSLPLLSGMMLSLLCALHTASTDRVFSKRLILIVHDDIQRHNLPGKVSDNHRRGQTTLS